MTHCDSCRTHTCSHTSRLEEPSATRTRTCSEGGKEREKKRKSGKHKVPTGEQTSRGLKTPIRSNLLCPCRPPLLSSFFLYFYPSFFFFPLSLSSPSLPPPMSLSVKSLPQQSASVCVRLHDCVCCWRVCVSACPRACLCVSLCVGVGDKAVLQHHCVYKALYAVFCCLSQLNTMSLHN